MVSFSKKKVLMETLGEKISRFRVEKGFSLEEIAYQLNIRKEYLEKIEQNRFEGLPPDVYVKGYLRRYAIFLGLDEDVVVKQYLKEKGIQEKILARRDNQIIQKQKGMPFLKISFFLLTPKMVAFWAFLFFSLFGSFYFYREIRKFSEKPLLVLATSQNNFSVDKDWVEIEGKVEKDNRVFINNEAVSVDKEGRFREKVFLRKGENKIIVKASNKFKKETVRELNVYAWYESAYSINKEELNF